MARSKSAMLQELDGFVSRLELRAAIAFEVSRGVSGDMLRVWDDHAVAWADEATRLRRILASADKMDSGEDDE